MDIKDLDFIKLLQKPLEEPVFAPHIEEQVSKQELETVVGGSEPVKTGVEVSKSALSIKIIEQPSVSQKAMSVTDNALIITKTSISISITQCWHEPPPPPPPPIP